MSQLRTLRYAQVGAARARSNVEHANTASSMDERSQGHSARFERVPCLVGAAPCELCALRTPGHMPALPGMPYTVVAALKFAPVMSCAQTWAACGLPFRACRTVPLQPKTDK